MIGAGALLMMLRKSVRLHGAIAILALVLLVVLDALLLRHVWEHGPVTMTMGRWLPPFGIAFTADLFGAVMALASAIAALAAAVFALQDIGGSGLRYGFFAFLMLLMAGVSGAFLTGDIFNLYVWFEVLLISSFGMLILGSEPRQIEGALKYAVLNLIGTTLFLIAVGYLYAIFGTLNMADIARKAQALRDGAPMVTLTALFVLAFGMKAAAFPVNFWLPASYHTPRIVVSALFGGLLTKIGIYALLRVTVMLLPVEREALSFVIGLSAALTLVVAALGALAQNDLRRLIGYVVIAGIGNMLAGVAIGTPAAVTGAILYALHSMVTMTALYMVAGEAARLSGSWQLSTLGGLWRRSSWFSAVSLALFLAAAGLPPLSGLWPKVALLKASIDIGAWWLAAAILVSAFVVTIALARVFLLAYWRPPLSPLAGEVAAFDRRTALPIALLAALALIFGLFPEPLLRHQARYRHGLRAQDHGGVPMNAAAILSVSTWIALVMLAAAFLLTVLRVVRGPSLPDRVVALDMLVGIVIGFIALIAIRTGFTLYIDIAISLGLVGFLATVAFARFILTGAPVRRTPEATVAVTAKPAPAAGPKRKKVDREIGAQPETDGAKRPRKPPAKAVNKPGAVLLMNRRLEMTDMALGKGPELLVELTADIVAAYVSNHVVPVGDLSHLIADVHSALSNTSTPVPVSATVEKPKPPVPIKKSIEDDYLICLEDGQKFKSLKRHLMTHYNMTPDEYREKWGLPADYPMVAPAYAEARSRLAKEMGLGQRRKRGWPCVATAGGFPAMSGRSPCMSAMLRCPCRCRISGGPLAATAARSGTPATPWRTAAMTGPSTSSFRLSNGWRRRSLRPWRAPSMTETAERKPGLEKAVVKLVRQLLQCDAEVVAEPSGLFRLGNGPHRYHQAVLQRALSLGLVRCSATALSATAEAKAHVRRALLAGEEAFPAQHRRLAEVTIEVEGVRRKAVRNLDESALAGIGRLKDRNGQPFFPAEALNAGDQLLIDFTRAQLQPRLTASWEPRLSTRGKKAAGGMADLSASAADARRRFARAMEAMGPELSGVAADVCCFAKGLELVERERQWPARSAKLMLRVALLVLARHYAPPSAGSGGRAHHWGSDGFRPGSRAVRRREPWLGKKPAQALKSGGAAQWAGRLSGSGTAPVEMLSESRGASAFVTGKGAVRVVDETSERWLSRIGDDAANAGDVALLRRLALAAALALPTVPLALSFAMRPVLALPVGVASVVSVFLIMAAVAFAKPGQKQQGGVVADETAFHACPGLAMLIDPQGQVEKLGGRDRQGFPTALRECLGELLAERVHVSDRITLLQALDMLRQGAPKALADVRVQKALSPADGRQFMLVRFDMTPIRDDNGDLSQIFVLAQDASEGEALRREAERRQEEARSAHETKSRFLAAVSHELRTPLNAILGFSDVLAGEYFGKLENDRQREYVGLIRQSGGHLLSVVNAMLDMSKIEAGRYELLIEPFAVSDAVEACRAMLDLQAREKGVTLTARTCRGLPEVAADRRAVQQILINLAGNAIKFTDRGGVVSMDAAMSGRNLVITVSDTGIGIAAEKLGLLGQAFTQVENAYSRQYEGTGLGLALVKGLVALHRGTFAITSKPGEGTVVTISLPADGPEARAEQEDAGVEAAEFPPRLKAAKGKALPLRILAGAGAAIARRPKPAAGAAAFIVAFSFVAANALWYQRGGHPAPFLATRDSDDPNAIAGYRPFKRATPDDVTTFKIERAPAAPDAPPSERTAAAPAPPQAASPVSPGAGALPAAETAAVGPGPVAADTAVVAGIQRALARRGLYDGADDGLMGPRTEAAILFFEEAEGLPQRGEATPALLAALEAGAGPAQQPVASSPARSSAAPLPTPRQAPRPDTRTPAGAAAGHAAVSPAARPLAQPVAQRLSSSPAEKGSARAEDPIAAAIRSADRQPGMIPPAEIPGETRAQPRSTGTVPASQLVLQIQKGLSNIAYTDVEVDGVAGSQTKAAIRRFQKHYRLPETGEPDELVLKKLKAIGAL
eukprot:g20087.t1